MDDYARRVRKSAMSASDETVLRVLRDSVEGWYHRLNGFPGRVHEYADGGDAARKIWVFEVSMYKEEAIYRGLKW